MKKGDSIALGNGFVFHIVSENVAGKAYVGYLKHKSEKSPIGQTSLSIDFCKQFIKDNI